MVHHKIDCEGLEFDLLITDVEELNRKAKNNILDITKISYHAYSYIAENYIILDSGSALGKNNGPILVGKKFYPMHEIPNLQIAIPGKMTTANLLLSIAFPEAKNKIENLFSDIEELILSDKVDAGLIIHENRFTYEQKGLKKIIDLGEFWELKTGSLIPLGGITANRNLPKETILKINRILKRSVEFAFKNPMESLNFMKKYSQEMDENIMYKHIELYVNDFTLNLGSEGKKSIRLLYEYAENLKLIPKLPLEIFIQS
jgi:1,4-dihydroxy-6-naphthoate synthase